METTSKMKLTTIILTFNLLLLTFNSIAQNVGINATGVVPDPSALLDLSATNKGFLITRVDTASIVSPAFGLMTLAPSDSCLYMYSGSQWIGMGGAGKSCPCNGFSTTPPPTPTFPCGGTVIPIVDVTNPTTGKIWMDRNLGASQVATSSNDAAAYGDLYQWGRCSDGHEKRTSGTTTTLSITDTPGHGNFIISGALPFDWRNPQNNSLWQGVTGNNNPCPTGYRIPTYLELDAERLSWSANNSVGAFASVLKHSVGGERLTLTNGSLAYVGNYGFYWSSTVSGIYTWYLAFNSSNAYMGTTNRGDSFSVRCIKN
jgi:uncharacterized protein (TIGR02145 family)